MKKQRKTGSVYVFTKTKELFEGGFKTNLKEFFFCVEKGKECKCLQTITDFVIEKSEFDGYDWEKFFKNMQKEKERMIWQKSERVQQS